MLRESAGVAVQGGELSDTEPEYYVVSFGRVIGQRERLT
jgi:hypothetical protein